MYDVIVVGAGACGLISAVNSAKNGKKVLLLEKLQNIGTKLKATGGGKCNLTNTSNMENFIEAFGKNGKFIRDALSEFNNSDLIQFLNSMGVKTDCLDGFRVFPVSHNSNSVVKAFEEELKRLHVELKCQYEVKNIKKLVIYLKLMIINLCM